MVEKGRVGIDTQSASTRAAPGVLDANTHITTPSIIPILPDTRHAVWMGKYAITLNYQYLVLEDEDGN
jgi:hypothetical protein